MAQAVESRGGQPPPSDDEGGSATRRCRGEVKDEVLEPNYLDTTSLPVVVEAGAPAEASGEERERVEGDMHGDGNEEDRGPRLLGPRTAVRARALGLPLVQASLLVRTKPYRSGEVAIDVARREEARTLYTFLRDAGSSDLCPMPRRRLLPVLRVLGSRSRCMRAKARGSIVGAALYQKRWVMASPAGPSALEEACSRSAPGRDSPLCAIIHAVVVAPRYRRWHIGARTLLRVLRDVLGDPAKPPRLRPGATASSACASVAFAHCHARNAAGIGLLRSCGFRTLYELGADPEVPCTPADGGSGPDGGDTPVDQTQRRASEWAHRISKLRDEAEDEYDTTRPVVLAATWSSVRKALRWLQSRQNRQSRARRVLLFDAAQDEAEGREAKSEGAAAGAAASSGAMTPMEELDVHPASSTSTLGRGPPSSAYSSLDSLRTADPGRHTSPTRQQRRSRGEAGRSPADLPVVTEGGSTFPLESAGEANSEERLNEVDLGYAALVEEYEGGDNRPGPQGQATGGAGFRARKARGLALNVTQINAEREGKAPMSAAPPVSMSRAQRDMVGGEAGAENEPEARPVPPTGPAPAQPRSRLRARGLLSLDVGAVNEEKRRQVERAAKAAEEAEAQESPAPRGAAGGEATGPRAGEAAGAGVPPLRPVVRTASEAMDRARGGPGPLTPIFEDGAGEEKGAGTAPPTRPAENPPAPRMGPVRRASASTATSSTASGSTHGGESQGTRSSRSRTSGAGSVFSTVGPGAWEEEEGGSGAHHRTLAALRNTGAPGPTTASSGSRRSGRSRLFADAASRLSKGTSTESGSRGTRSDGSIDHTLHARHPPYARSFFFDHTGSLVLQEVRIPEGGRSNVSEHLVQLRTLGRGAGGVVHLCVHVPTMRLLALKAIRVFEDEKRHQLLQELRALNINRARLSDGIEEDEDAPCPAMLAIYDTFNSAETGTANIAVEYMRGGSLQDRIDRRTGCTERFLAATACRALEGLAFLHQKRKIHRDIKPANILINASGEAKISDFGIARGLERTGQQARTFVGTLMYMAPERIVSRGYSYQSDIWSLGLSILTAALGRFPFSTSSGYWGLARVIRDEQPQALPSGFSDQMRSFVGKCLAKDPAARPSASELLRHPWVQEAVGWREADYAIPSVEDEELKEFVRPSVAFHFANVAGAVTRSDSAPEEFLDLPPPYLEKHVQHVATDLGTDPGQVARAIVECWAEEKEAFRTATATTGGETVQIRYKEHGAGK